MINPMYDEAFKFLMQDKEAAILLLSSIIGEKIISLKFEPQERSIFADPDEQTAEAARARIRTLRFDFAATIVLKDDTERDVGLEIQKSREPAELIRFRKYLSDRLKNKKAVQKNNPRAPRQLYSIYLFGGEYSDILPRRPMLKIVPSMSDALTGEVLSSPLDFMTALHQRSWVIQTSYLPEEPATDVDRALIYFNESRYRVENDKKLINVPDSLLHDSFSVITRRLIYGATFPAARSAMEEEELQRLNEELREIKEKEQEEVIAEQESKIYEQESKIYEQESTIAKHTSALAEKDRQMAELLARIERLEKK